VVGWPLDKEGRRLSAASAIFSEDGDLKGLARATWIDLSEQSYAESAACRTSPGRNQWS
jgi:hypothetical protein